VNRKQLILTFDYEVFLGKRSGSVDNCLIEPTNKILEILRKHEQIGVFFIDTTYLFRLSELVNMHNPIKVDFEKINKQLIQIVKDGHYIFHHLHPHWLDAKYIIEINEWDLTNNSRFVFQLLNDNEKKQVFEFSFNFLSDIYVKANSTKLPNGYRAGGLFIEPFDVIKPFFEKYNVKHEFSVLSGSKRNDFPFVHDFSQAPSERKYHFSDIIQQENQEGSFIQYPITSIKIKGLNKIINGIYYRMNKNNLANRPFGNGKSVSSKINAGIKKKGFINYFSMEIPASIEMLNPILVNTFLTVLKRSSYLHILSHPKLITPNSLEQLDFMLGKVNKHYSIEKIDF
jgi:hypothetical protein